MMPTLCINVETHKYACRRNSQGGGALVLPFDKTAVINAHEPPSPMPWRKV
jgi:hypothetical protein